MHAGCVFVPRIQTSKTRMSGSFESVRWNACVHRLDLGLYSHPKELLVFCLFFCLFVCLFCLFGFFFFNGVRTHVNSKRKISSTGKILLRGRSNPRSCIKQDSDPNTVSTSYSGPILMLFSWIQTDKHRHNLVCSTKATSNCIYQHHIHKNSKAILCPTINITSAEDLNYFSSPSKQHLP